MMTSPGIISATGWLSSITTSPWHDNGMLEQAQVALPSALGDSEGAGIPLPVRLLEQASSLAIQIFARKMHCWISREEHSQNVNDNFCNLLPILPSLHFFTTKKKYIEGSKAEVCHLPCLQGSENWYKLSFSLITWSYLIPSRWHWPQ